MATKDSLQELKDLISLILMDIDKYDYPYVYDMVNDPEVRPNLEENIINLCKETGMTIQDAILQIERDYNPNMLKD